MTLRIAFAYPFHDRTWLGGRNYFSSLFTAIRAAASNDVELVLVTGRTTVTSLPEQFPLLEVVRTPIMDRLSASWAVRQFARLPSALERDPVFAGLLRRRSVDVLSHSGGLGKESRVRCLGWLPDFQFMRLPGYWTPRQLRDTRRNYNAACRQCDALIVSSRAALQDLKSFSPNCLIPVHVLHFVPIPFHFAKLRSKDDLCKQYRLPLDYFHLPNQFWAHKNHGLVIDALAMLKQRGTEATVVCTGHATDLRRPEYFESLMAQCRFAGVEANFRVLGVVPYPDMQALMAHSRAVVNPSRFEGWSTSVEEAKAFGKQVLLSDIAVHREQAPENSAYFSPDCAEELAELMHRSLISDPPEISPLEIERRNSEAMIRFGRGYLQLVRSL